MALALGLIATGAATVVYLDRRGDLKKGDVIIQEEAARERAEERLYATAKIQHHLHPQHKLILVNGTTPFWCDACRQSGEGYSYRCNTCNFNLHEACATSDDILLGLMAKKTIYKTFVHEHPLTLASGSSHKCRYCKNEVDQKYRYYCSQCDKHFHLMCATHPTRLSSFLHPQHELELKTKHHFAKCAVCHHGGKSNGRVYSCESCQFYVHSDCAVMTQYIQHPLHHGNHTLVYGAVSKDKSVRCSLCKKKCKDWSYSCSVCKDVHIHQACLDPAATKENGVTRTLLDEYAEAVGESLGEQLSDLAMGETRELDITGQFIDECSEVVRESLGEQFPEPVPELVVTEEPDVTGQFVDECNVAVGQSFGEQLPELSVTDYPDVTAQCLNECDEAVGQSCGEQLPELAVTEEPAVTAQCLNECDEAVGQSCGEQLPELAVAEEPGVTAQCLIEGDEVIGQSCGEQLAEFAVAEEPDVTGELLDECDATGEFLDECDIPIGLSKRAMGKRFAKFAAGFAMELLAA